MATVQQLKYRIQDRMREYARCHRLPVDVPRATRGMQLPQRAELKDISEQTPSKENFVINLHTIKQALTPNEQEVLAFRLMGYRIEDIAKSMLMAPKTIEGYLTSINKTCKEVNNV